MAIQTKSDRILRDIDLLDEINRNAKCVVQMTLTTYDDDLCKIVDAFKSDKIAVCWDTSHANLMPFDQADVIRKLGKRIVQTHLGSNYKERDDHALPIFGNVNWKNVMGAFNDIGYRYELNLEAVPVEKTFVPTYMKLAFESVTMLKEIFEEKYSELTDIVNSCITE